jgi:hypothetical protein
MKWSILVLTQPSRATFLARLLDILEPQVRKALGVEVTVRFFDMELSLGENRQKMLEASESEYVNFVDDDDLVPADYVMSILPLLDGVDYVGFRVQCHVDGRPFSRTFHSLRFSGWSNDAFGHYRDISHINPIRRELALLALIEGGFGEDERWAARLRATGKVKTEHYIDRVMYDYYYRSVKTEQAEAVSA